MKFANGLAGTALVAMSALALPAHAQISRPRYEPVTWTGPYVGLQAGGRLWSGQSNEKLVFDTDLDGQYDDIVSHEDTPTRDFFSPGYCDGGAVSKNISDGCVRDKDKFDFGVHAGYDQQIGNFVIGAVAEYRRPGIVDMVSGFSEEPDTYVMTRKFKQEASLRLRAGVALNNLLVYVTGGGTWGTFKNEFFTTNSDDDIDYTRVSTKSSVFGYKAGAGVEQRLNRYISIGLQYSYTSLKPKNAFTVTIADGDDDNPFTRVDEDGTKIRRTGNRFTSSTIGAVVNFRF